MPYLRRTTSACRLVLLAVIAIGALPALAQTTDQTAPAAPQPPADAGSDDLFQKTVALDIATSEYYALVAWARRLGLSDAGSVDELRARLYASYGVSAPPAAAPSTRTVSIVSADRTEYLGGKDGGEASVRFSGHVSLAVKDEETGETLTINADEVLVNRDANILSARGNIVFERKKASGSDFFLGEALELDMKDWSGAFLDGESRQAAGSDNALYFRADDILKRGSDVLVFKDGVVSSCDDAHPHYSIRASKIWILGGNEWAMRDATLSVGEIPVLYLPFFYYPGEEIVFHPVLGYDARFGRYVQTTTYLVGEKPQKQDDIGILRLTDGGQGYERSVQGVFLRTGKGKKAPSSGDFVKVMADLYSNLGGLVAGQAQLASLGPLKSLTGFIGVGLSRSVFPSGSTYSPFVEATGYTSDWNAVDLFGASLPFRFGVELAATVDLKPFTLTISSPFYSDSYFNRDFRDRSEDMNWLQFLDQTQDTTTIAKISSFTDSIGLAGSVPASALPAWISTASLSRFTSSLSWSPVLKPTPSTTPDSTLFAVDPTREFFVPYEWTLIDAQATLAGTLYQYPGTTAAAAANPSAANPGVTAPGSTAPSASAGPVAPSQALDIQVPWSEPEKPQAAEPADSLPGFVPPALATTEQVASRVPFSGSVSWSLTPTVTWRRRFLTGAWEEPSNVDWSPLYETATIRNLATLTLSGNIQEGLLTSSLALSASNQVQVRPLVSDDTTYVSPTLLSTWLRQDAQYRSDKLTATLKLTSSPLQDYWLWSPTGLSYSLVSTLYEYTMDTFDTGTNTATYRQVLADWTTDTVTTHALSLILGIKPWGYVQSLTLSADLPPILQGYRGALSLKSPFATLSVSTAYSVPAQNADFEWDPVTANITVGNAPGPTLTGSIIWDTTTTAPTSLGAAVAWQGLSAGFTASEAQAYSLVWGSGWQASADTAFRVNAATLSYVTSWHPPAAWRNRIDWTVDVNAAARQSLLRFTDSYLNVTLGLTFKVYQFLDITFASTSRNSSLWRYYPGFFAIPSEANVEPINPLVDLAKSFNFFNDDDRRASLFKLKSLSVTAKHALHDWDLAFTFAANPVLDETSLSYIFKTSWSVSLAWRSVSQIKSTYSRDGDTVSWK